MGVVLVQLSQADAATTKAPAEASNAVLVAGSGKASAIRHQQAASSSDGGEGPKRNRALGLLGVLVACACSGLAGDRSAFDPSLLLPCPWRLAAP